MSAKGAGSDGEGKLTCFGTTTRFSAYYVVSSNVPKSSSPRSFLVQREYLLPPHTHGASRHVGTCHLFSECAELGLEIGKVRFLCTSVRFLALVELVCTVYLCCAVEVPDMAGQPHGFSRLPALSTLLTKPSVLALDLLGWQETTPMTVRFPGQCLRVFPLVFKRTAFIGFQV